MRKVWIFILILIVLVAVRLLPDRETEQAQVVVTTTHMASITETLLQGTGISVRTLFPYGVDPHLYTMTYSDLQSLNAADLIIASGLHLEASMYEGLHNLKDTKDILFVGDELDPGSLIQVSNIDPKYDPHFWFDLDLTQQATDLIANRLLASFENQLDKQVLMNNQLAFQSDLADLMQRVASLRESQQLDYLVTTHDAFSYLARDLGFELKTLIGVTTESDFSLKEIQDLADFMKEKQVHEIYLESTVSDKPLKKLQEILAAQDFAVVLKDSFLLGDSLLEGQNFLDFVRHNLDLMYE